MKIPSNIVIKTLLRAALAGKDMFAIDGKRATYSRVYKKGTAKVTISFPFSEHQQHYIVSQKNVIEQKAMTTQPVQQKTRYPDIVIENGQSQYAPNGTPRYSSSFASDYIPKPEPGSGLEYQIKKRKIIQERKAKEKAMRNEIHAHEKLIIQEDVSVQAEQPIQASAAAVREVPFPAILSFKAWILLLHCCETLVEKAPGAEEMCVLYAHALRGVPKEHRKGIIHEVITFLRNVQCIDGIGNREELCTITEYSDSLSILWNTHLLESFGKVRVYGWVECDNRVLLARKTEEEAQQDFLRMVLRGRSAIYISEFICQEYGRAIFTQVQHIRKMSVFWYRRLQRLEKFCKKYNGSTMILPTYSIQAREQWYMQKMVHVYSHNVAS